MYNNLTHNREDVTIGFVQQDDAMMLLVQQTVCFCALLSFGEWQGVPGV